MVERKQLVHLDFSDRDTEEALAYLQDLVARGRVSGMIFAVSMRRGRPAFGATGRLAANDLEAAGYAAALSDRFTEPYLFCHSGE